MKFFNEVKVSSYTSTHIFQFLKPHFIFRTGAPNFWRRPWVVVRSGDDDDEDKGKDGNSH
jgi:hypothetical protein